MWLWFDLFWFSTSILTPVVRENHRPNGATVSGKENVKNRGTDQRSSDILTEPLIIWRETVFYTKRKEVFLRQGCGIFSHFVHKSIYNSKRFTSYQIPIAKNHILSHGRKSIFEPEINARFEIEWILLFIKTKAWIESGRLSGNSVKLLLCNRKWTNGSCEDRRFPSIWWMRFPCSSST